VLTHAGHGFNGAGVCQCEVVFVVSVDARQCVVFADTWNVTDLEMSLATVVDPESWLGWVFSPVDFGVGWVLGLASVALRSLECESPDEGGTLDLLLDPVAFTLEVSMCADHLSALAKRCVFSKS